MKGLPSATYREIDQSTVPPALLAGRHGVITPTLFGPTDKPYEVSTVDDLKAMFGGPDAVSPYFAQLRRAIQRGTVLMIQRLTKTGALAATYADAVKKVTINAKWVGTWANAKLGIKYTPVNAGVCTLEVIYSENTELNEVHTADTFANLITKVNTYSKLIEIETEAGFAELAAIANTQNLAGGTDGAFADEQATQAGYAAALDKMANVENLDTVGALGIYTDDWYDALALWCDERGDLIGLFEIDPTLTPAQAQTFVDALTTKSSFVAMYYSSEVTAYSPEEGLDVKGGCLVDVQSAYSYSDTVSLNRLRAPAGGKRGILPNIKSFKYNMLSPGQKVAADKLVNAGVNMVGSHPYFGPVVWGANTRALANSALDAVHVRRMLIDLHTRLAPVFQDMIFDPMDPTTWRLAYGKAKPILANLEAERGIYEGWSYNGDQEASKVEDARFNRQQDLANGLYKVKISLVPVGYIHSIEFTVQVNNLLSLYQTSANA